MKFRKSSYNPKTIGTIRRARPHEKAGNDNPSSVKVWKATPEQLDEILQKMGSHGYTERLPRVTR